MSSHDLYACLCGTKHLQSTTLMVFVGEGGGGGGGGVRSVETQINGRWKSAGDIRAFLYFNLLQPIVNTLTNN